MENQMHQCREIIADKDKLINEFMRQLKDKDKHYVKAIALMNDDIDKLIAAMSQ